MTEQKFLQDLEKKLWISADKLLPSLDVAVYKHVVLGMVFVKYVSDGFETRRQELLKVFKDPAHDYYLGEDSDDFIEEELENRDYYTEKNVFLVPVVAKWQYIQDSVPLAIQKKIAHILSTLDDKIELNHKMNQTLEEMAQALFNSWFVDFDPVHAKADTKIDEALERAATELGIAKEVLELFPSEFKESEMGMIPKGWEVSTIEDEVTIYGGTTPSAYFN